MLHVYITENQADDAEPSYMEPGPSCFTNDAAPLSDSGISTLPNARLI